MTSIEQELEEKLLRFSEQNHDTHVILFNRKDFNRTDEKTRSEIDIQQLTNGGISWEEYRHRNNMPIDVEGTFLHLSSVVPWVDEPEPEPDATEPPDNSAEAKPDALEATPQPQEPEADTQARSLATRLLEKTATRITTRLKKAVESKAEKESLDDVASNLATDHRAIIVDSIDVLADAETITDAILDDLATELRAITKEDVSKIDWNRFGRGIINGKI
jgi:hypothetical protein